eukprot:GFYU01003634.1.p1 GENE.GFYU01003634.1~~GFYU01003634.1.p1  ORF type:complete len:208 (-),score=39.99 GFYU01003634.1:74-661(-)
MLREFRRSFNNRSARWADPVRVNLWLGSGADAANLEKMKEKGITHVLNVANDVENFHPSDFVYCNLNVADFGQDKGISRVFEQAASFVTDAIGTTVVDDKNGECTSKVLVHCAWGVNRSATVTIALLMMLEDKSLRDAWRDVVGARKCVCPLNDNKIQLVEFEKRHRGKVSMTVEQFKDATLGRASTGGSNHMGT